VDFQPGLSGTITLTTGKLLIATSLTIDGPGADVITVSGNHASQVFQIEATAAISGLTVADASGANHGGGIFNHNTLTLTDSVLIDNFDPYGGGGIYSTGRLTVRGCTLAGNHTTLHVGSGGGAIYNGSGTVVVIASLLTGNSSDAGGAIENNGGTLMVSDSTLTANVAGSGAGIFSVFPAATATIEHSLLSDNQAVVAGEQNDGGAIENEGGRLTVTDSTLSGNAAASSSGGAIDTETGPAEIRDSTLSGNSASYGGGMFAGGGTIVVSNSTVSGNSAAMQGGGIEDLAYGLTITNSTLSGNSAAVTSGGIDNYSGWPLPIRDTIVAGNTASSSPDVQGALTSQGHNLIGDGTGGLGYSSTDLVGTSANPIDPRLGPLADNGGPTRTMALLPGSPAIGAGDPTDAPEFDQRGPGYPRVINGLIDIGSFEVQSVTAPFVVINTNDAGPGSLRQAILNADASTGSVTITFAIPGSGVQTIRPLSPLPTLTTTVVVDGTSQPGYTGQPLIVLDGSAAGLNADGLTVAAGGSTIKELAINGFGGAGIHLEGAGGDLVTGDYLGTDVTGTLARGNAIGIRIDGTSGNTIGGTTAAARNLISGNRQDGLRIGLGASGNLVEGNFIGSDLTGTGAVPNGANGITVSSATNTIGGTVAGAGNLISGNTGDGLNLGGIDNQVLGNLIGTNAAHTAALGNRDGISIGGPNNTVGGAGAAASNLIAGNHGDGVIVNPGATANILQGNVIAANTGTGVVIAAGAAANVLWANAIGTTPAGRRALPNGLNGVVVAGSNNLIGGTAAGTGNVISGNAFDGVDLTGRGAVFNVVQGNLIGTDATGTRVLGNGTEGINLDGGAAENTIGGTDASASNVLAGNGGDGVGLADPGTSANLIQGNSIGTDLSGTLALGNGANGVYFENNASGNTVGGTVGGAANTIAFNTDDGVAMVSSTGDAIQENRIYSSGYLGIELINGGNHDQAFPTLTSVTSDGSTTTIAGTLASAPDTTFTLEFFANDVCNPSGYGEGQTFLGAAAVSTDDSGTATFTVTVGAGVAAGQFVSATATDPAENTSAFAACVPVSSPPGAGQPPGAVRAVVVPYLGEGLPTPAPTSTDPAGRVQQPADVLFALRGPGSIPAPGSGATEPRRWPRPDETGEDASGPALAAPASEMDDLDLWGWIA
jgi:hypothetical protein